METSRTLPSRGWDGARAKEERSAEAVGRMCGVGVVEVYNFQVELLEEDALGGMS